MILRQCFLWIDKALFCSGILLGVQFPGLVSHYTQRLGGHLDEARRHLIQYQVMADQWTNGNLDTLLEKYYGSDEPIFQETGLVLERLMERVDALSTQLKGIGEANVFEQLRIITFQADQEIMTATLNAFTFNVPLTQDALLIGILFGVTLSLLWAGGSITCRYCVKRAFGRTKRGNSLPQLSSKKPSLFRRKKPTKSGKPSV